MSLFDKIKNKRNILSEKSSDFSSRQRSDNINMLNKLFGTSERSRKTAQKAKSSKSNVKFSSGAEGNFPSGSAEMGGESDKFVKGSRQKLDTEINKRRSAELTKSDAINRSMGGGPSTEGAGGANQGSTPLKKGKPFSKAESDAIQTRSLNKKTKQFVSKPGTTKSKGGGATTGGEKNLVVNPKSKGTTPVKVNVTKPIKQSEVSRRAKTYTADINKANKKRQQTVRGRRANRIKDATGGKKTGSLRGGNLSFAGDRSGAYSTTKADIEARRGLRSAGASGDFSATMPQDKRKSKQKIRDTRVKKYKTPDPFKIDTSKAAKEVAKDFGTKPVKGGLDFGKPGTGIKDIIKKFQPRDTSTRQAAEKAEKSFRAFQDRLSKQSANIKQSKIYIKPKSASASTGGGANYSSTSFRTGNMKSGRTSSRKPFDSMGGGRKPPFGGGRSTAAGAGGIDPEIVSGKFIPNTKTKVSKIPKVRGGGKIGTVLAVAATAPYVYDAIKRGGKQKKGKKKFLDINKDFERVKS